jgi:hypothetical protein
MAEEIINRVTNSILEVFDLEDYYQEGTRTSIDLKSWLEHEFILREKDFRAQVKAYNWEQHKNQYVAIYCSNDAIIADWAFMLITIALKPYAKHITFGTLIDLETNLYQNKLASLDLTIYKDKPIIIKGCAKKPVPTSAYIMATNMLQPIAKSIMFGEACSAVPLFKRISSQK